MGNSDYGLGQVLAIWVLGPEWEGKALGWHVHSARTLSAVGIASLIRGWLENHVQFFGPLSLV